MTTLSPKQIQNLYPSLSALWSVRVDRHLKTVGSNQSANYTKPIVLWNKLWASGCQLQFLGYLSMGLLREFFLLIRGQLPPARHT